MADNIFVSTLHQFKLAQSSHAICSASSAFPDNFTVWSPFHTQPASKGRTLLCTANNLQAQAQKQAQALAHKQIVVLWFPLHRASALVRNFTLHKIQEQVVVESIAAQPLEAFFENTNTCKITSTVWKHRHMNTCTWQQKHTHTSIKFTLLLALQYYVTPKQKSILKRQKNI